MSGLTLPDSGSVANMLRTLLDKPVAVAVGKGKPERLGPRAKGAIALYCEDGGDLKAAWMCDAKFGGAAAGALAIIPKAVVDEKHRDEGFAGLLGEALAEVFNVGASLFNDGDTHLKYTEMVSKEVTPDLRKLVNKAADRLDLTIEITGYDPGTLSIFLL